jgi:3-oxoacyl-(acyl-carrier-protein) synthase
LGDARQTVESLQKGVVALKRLPVYGDDGGECVPLALRSEFSNSVPPRWWDDLRNFIRPLHGDDWGSPRKPVFLTSSNFGIDGLYGLAKKRDRAFSGWSTPQACAENIRKEMNWGSNIHILSHACVTAQLGLFQAAQWITKGLAESALVLSFDYVGPFVAAGFNSLKILNEQMPSPYSRQDTGSIGLGDGLAWAILDLNGEGPRIQAQALYNEMYHFTGNAPEGEGFTRTLSALAPHLEASRFWIKGHGTGTLEAGRLEAEAANRCFPGSPLVSWKGSIGHTLGSCALVELALALEAIETGTIPATVGTAGPCFSPDVATEPFAAPHFEKVLLLSNAFGGAHGAMVIENA